MIGVVVAIVVSPWYSSYFNQSLKEQALQNYRVSGSALRSSSSAELARIFHKPGLDAGIEIHADEQMALESIARRNGNIKQIVSKLRHHVDSVRKSSGSESTIANIALLKLIRVELAAAELYLSQGAYSRAQALASAAIDDLKRQSSFFEEGPQRMNLQKIFDLTARIDRAEGDTDGEHRARALKRLLTNPATAREWFNANGMKGYAGSYTPEFLIKFLLSRDNQDSRVSALTQALDVCKNPDVRHSTRTHVMQTAFNEAEGLHAPSLRTTVVKTWLSTCAKNPIRFEPDAMLVWTLKDKLAQSKSVEHRILIRSKMKESIEKDLLYKVCVQAYFDSYENDQIQCGVFPPKTQEAGRRLATEIDELLELCHKVGADDFSLLVTKLSAVNASSQATKCEELLYQILDQLKNYKGANYKAKLERVIPLVGGVASIMSKPKTKESDASVYRMLERVKRSCNWNDEQRFRLLICLYDNIPMKETAKRDQCLSDILALERKLKISRIKNVDLNFFILHNIMIGKNRPDEGQKMMEEIRAACGTESPMFLQLSMQLLGYRRAYPSYCKETLKISREKPFPAKYFEETPDLVARQSGKQSAKYCRALLWLSQFEYCRGNYDRALKLSNDILKTPGAQRMDSYLAANDLRSQILGEKPHFEGEVLAAPDSLLELHCLSNIYRQLSQPEKADRVDELRTRVHERSNIN